ncbi:hypothetical protein [Actinomycetospora flava]|uniref:Thymidylate kinase n=1 Tax=Actinomycetospora flava TaxID=3129232 RepID=A0ABU8MDU7_9PSEU
MAVVIVAVEGPSAAGKTSWCAQQSWPVVAEYAPTGEEPDGSNPEVQVRFWTAVNSRRWRQALELEHSSAVVLCDSDPVKLHYSWCLARVGADSWSRFDSESQLVRAAVTRGELGFADLVVVSLPELDVLRARREGDPTRRRRSFDLHATLAGPLREWYRAVEEAGAARVRWEFPRWVEPAAAAWTGVVRDRCDSAAFERLLQHLPAVEG